MRFCSLRGGRGTTVLTILIREMLNCDISVCQEKDSFLYSLLPEAPDDLKSCKCFSRTCCHNEQNSVLPFCNCLYCPVNYYPLIISKGFLPIGKILLGYDPLPVFIKPLPFTVLLPEKFRGRKFVQWNFLFYLSKSACPVVEQKGVSVRAERKGISSISAYMSACCMPSPTV